MIPMIEHVIEPSFSLPLIGRKSGPSKWLEDLSRATSYLRSIQSLEDVTSLPGDSQIYGLIYPSQSLMSYRLFEEISRKNEDVRPEKFQFREPNNNLKAKKSSEVTTINTLLTKTELKTDFEISGIDDTNRKKSTGDDLKDGISQAELNVKLKKDLIETQVEMKYPVKSGTREELLREIINRHGEKIENNQLGQNLNTLKQSLKSPASTSNERLKVTEKIYEPYNWAQSENSPISGQNSFSITEEHSHATCFKNILSEKISSKFSSQIEGFSKSKELLEEKSDKIQNPDQHSEASFADYHISNSKSLADSEEQLVNKKELNLSSEKISEQFSSSVEKESEIFADYPLHNSKSLVNPESLVDSEKQLADKKELNLSSEKISEQFSRHIQGNLTPKSSVEKESEIFADYYTGNSKSLADSEKQLVDKKELNLSSEKISEQFLRHIQGNLTSKSFLKEKLESIDGKSPYFTTDNTKNSSKDFESKSNQLLERVRENQLSERIRENQLTERVKDNQLSERIRENQLTERKKEQLEREQFHREQLDRIFLLDSKISENKNNPDVLSLTNINLLIEDAYSNSTNKSDLREENRELFLNLIENINQVVNQNNRDNVPSKQNVFNIQVRGEGLTSEKDLINLSDRLVLILKDQARRHGIDLS
jgi:hypothetical protein